MDNKNTCSLNGKKLLILGGSVSMVEMVHLAQSMGCKVYITDYYDTSRSPCKLIADGYADISITDHDAVVEYIKENKIDGVMTGFTDSYLFDYLNICKKAGLPYYGNEESFGIATDKMLFKNACRKFGVSVVPGTNAYCFEDAQKFAKENKYPLMLKPVDNSGSRGVIKCESEAELKKCYEYALSYSRSKNVIVERFMDCPTISSVYQMIGDEPYFAAICDRDTYYSGGSGSGIVIQSRYPSEYLQRYIEEIDLPMRNMLKGSGFRDGMVTPMAFVDDDGFYMCEMCYRPSGGHHYVLINDQNGIDGLKMLIEFAVTGEVKDYNPENETPDFHDYCGMVHIIGIPGKKVEKLSGLEDVMNIPGVIDAYWELSEGDTVGQDGTTAQALASVWLRSKDKSDFERIVAEIKETLKIYDADGNSLILF